MLSECDNWRESLEFFLKDFLIKELNYRRGDVAQSIVDSNRFIPQATRMYFNFLLDYFLRILISL